MKKFLCQICGYVYDESEGDSTQDIAPNTTFEDLPETWGCPLCGVDKSNFEEI